MRRIGVLMSLAETDPEAQARVAAFRKGLQTLGWAEGATSASTFAGRRPTPH
jgi:putative ABC transport system substrate-binding protein